MSNDNTSTRPSEEILAIDSLDCSGLLCPLPVYQAAIVLGRLEDGDVLRLITTDPGALEDIPAMTRQRGDSLLDVTETEDRQEFLIRKGIAS